MSKYIDQRGMREGNRHITSDGTYIKFRIKFDIHYLILPDIV